MTVLTLVRLPLYHIKISVMRRGPGYPQVILIYNMIADMSGIKEVLSGFLYPCISFSCYVFHAHIHQDKETMKVVIRLINK